MIVQCVNCETRFQLDESRVPLAGVRVRCSRCKESFFLSHPSASEAEAIDEVAAQAVQEDRLPAPDAARDLDSGDELSFASAIPTPQDLATPNESPSSPLEPDPGSALGGLGDDEDWQFGDDMPEQEVAAEAGPSGLEAAEQGALDAALADPGDASDAFDGDVADDIPFLDDAQATDALVVEEPVAAPPFLEEGASPSIADDDGAAAFGSVEDFSSLIQEVTSAAESEGPGLASSSQPEAHTEAGSAFGVPSDMSLGNSDSGAGEVAAPLAGDQLGDPEDWNFFSETPASDYQKPPNATMPSLESRAAAAARDDLAAADDDAFHDPARAGAGVGWEVRHAIARIGHTMGWLVTVSLTVVALAQGFFLQDVESLPSLGPLAVGEAVVDRMVPSWIDNQYQPRLLAVRGSLSNPTGQAISHGQTLLVALLDATGSPLAAPPALAGISLSEESIRELPIDQLRMAQARAAGALARSTLGPGEEIGFTALFDEVPPGAVSLQLQAGPVWAAPEPQTVPSDSGLSASEEQSASNEWAEPEIGSLE